MDFQSLKDNSGGKYDDSARIIHRITMLCAKFGSDN